MSLQVSTVPTSIKVAKQDRNHRSANFHRSIWGDHFLFYASNSVKKLQDLREEIKRILKANVNKPTEKLPWLIESSDVFNKLKDNNGNFKKSLVKDIRGMLSLYESRTNKNQRIWSVFSQGKCE
ncbi:hypothetical protein Pint_04326 [Pistacia integerrima]|uniref:Uncharacterized protein n=1 Tax=Pistacia integerrima TaxID=434235 RepID=A0ACC0Z5S5_9ROSI|nr:hypothetical protein Pint_04326 [Pistacia integerrima]